MIREYPPQARSEDLLQNLTALWEASVRASHHFLTEDEIIHLRPLVRHALELIPKLFVLEEADHPLGMIGLSSERIEIFFLAPEAIGRGCSRRMIEAVRDLPGSAEISVNEENHHARAVYEHLGYRPVERHERDDQEAEHPILILRNDIAFDPDVRLARTEDLPEILSIYESARDFMRGTGNPDQWGTSYPEKSLLIEDIQNGELYVILGDSQDTKDGEIIGVFMLTFGGEPTYRKIDGAWHTEMPYGVIHRIASRPGAKGILHTAVNYAARLAPALRIDTHADNRVMQERILKEGFEPCGTIWLADGTPRIAYELENGRRQS